LDLEGEHTIAAASDHVATGSVVHFDDMAYKTLHTQMWKVNLKVMWTSAFEIIY